MGGQITVRRALDNETNEVIAPKHNKGRTVSMSPRIAEALAALPRRGLWVIAAEDGRSVDYDRAGGMLEAITGLYARVGLAKPAMPIHALRHTFGTVMARRVCRWGCCSGSWGTARSRPRCATWT